MIEAIGISKTFNEHKVLDGLNLKINTGETCVIIGRSGCGKSVFLKHIVGLLKPDNGKVLVDGKEVGKLSQKEINELRMKISMVFQGGALFDSMTVGENVGFGLIEHTKIGKKEETKIRNAVYEINKKVASVGGPDKTRCPGKGNMH